MKNSAATLPAAALLGAALAWSGWQAKHSNLIGIALIGFLAATLLSYFSPKRCAIIGAIVGLPVGLVGALTGEPAAMMTLMVALFGALVGYGLDRTWRDNDGTPA